MIAELVMHCGRVSACEQRNQWYYCQQHSIVITYRFVRVKWREDAWDEDVCGCVKVTGSSMMVVCEDDDR